MSADDECEEWSEATEAKSKRVIRMRGVIRRVLACEEVRALLDEGKRIATEKRRAREVRERDPERAR